MAAWAVGLSSQGLESAARPFSFFTPVIELRADEFGRIAAGRVVIRTIDSSGHDLAVLAAGSLKTSPDAFISRVTDIVSLRKSRLVPAIARFSNPPTPEDLEGLTLSDQDLESLSGCRPGDCGLKVAEKEIRRMQAALASGGLDRRMAAERAFREILLERVPVPYWGLDALPPYHDKSRPLDVAQAFGRLAEQSVYLIARRSSGPPSGGPAADASRTLFCTGRSKISAVDELISVTHVVIVRPGVADLPEVLVGSTQVYANHYTDAALAVTTLERGANGTAFLGYLYRARVDVLGNFLVRRVVERRIEDEVERVFVLQLERLQSGA